MRRPIATAAFALLLIVGLAWDAPGHRAITEVALGLLPADAPTWLRDADVRAQIAFQANEPDHWRGIKNAVLAHENAPDHYLDLELLEGRGLSLRTLPALRYEFVALLARAPAERTAAQDTAPAVAPTPDAQPTPPRRGVDRRMITDDVGFLPYAIGEHYAKLVSSFNTLRILERLNDPARRSEMSAARANVVHEMGQLSHFVGDAGQPLHTTIHHHGWIGDNPHGYTTDRGFHQYVDGEVVALHGLDAQGLEKRRPTLRPIAPERVWDETIALIERSFAAVVPLYEAQKDGSLQTDAGRKLIAERMADSAGVLAGLYWAAWKDSDPSEQQVKDFVHYDKLPAPTRVIEQN